MHFEGYTSIHIHQFILRLYCSPPPIASFSSQFSKLASTSNSLGCEIHYYISLEATFITSPFEYQKGC